jgi:hypothetical protein
MYLQTNTQEAVCITMDPGDLLGVQSPGHGYRGQMEISLQDHAIARTHQHVLTIPATQGHTVAHFIDAIIAAGNDEYDFTTEGRGCAGWMLDQFRLFLHQGLIQSGYNEIESAINQGCIDGQPTGSRPATYGYYMRNTRGRGWSKRSSGGAIN